MRTRTVKAQKVIKFTTKATLRDLGQYTGTKPAELFAEAMRLGCMSREPQIWQYTGADGKPDTEFTLEIMVPICGEIHGEPSAPFEIADIPEFKALVQLHEGPWSDIGPVYCTLMKHVAANGLPLTGITREVYIRCDFEEQENCITEVMIGLA